MSDTEAYQQIEGGFEASVLERFNKLFPESISGVRAALKLSERTLARRGAAVAASTLRKATASTD